MDKMLNWNFTGQAYRAMIDSANAQRMSRDDAFKLLDAFTDFCPSFDPIYLEPSEGSAMQEGDTVFIFHFREDKTWQIAEALMNGIPGQQKLRN
jgi:bisphosphoglycerate-independent phosphoglycerate mutase (AlkP superfamily)